MALPRFSPSGPGFLGKKAARLPVAALAAVAVTTTATPAGASADRQGWPGHQGRPGHHHAWGGTETDRTWCALRGARGGGHHGWNRGGDRGGRHVRSVAYLTDETTL